MPVTARLLWLLGFADDLNGTLIALVPCYRGPKNRHISSDRIALRVGQWPPSIVDRDLAPDPVLRVAVLVVKKPLEVLPNMLLWSVFQRITGDEIDYPSFVVELGRKRDESTIRAYPLHAGCFPPRIIST